MRMLNRLNPGPGLADFWTEFKRPNPYRWPILAASVLFTGALLYLLGQDRLEFDWIMLGLVAVIAAVLIFVLKSEGIGFNIPRLSLAAGLTVGLMYLFTEERVRIPPAPPEVTYITTFAPDRTDEEIIQRNLENQKRIEAREAELAEREEQRRELYRTLGELSGMDVERIEREAAQERAAHEAAEEARREAMVGGSVDTEQR